MNDSVKADDSRGAMWDRLDQQGDFIGKLARSQAATEANLAALAASVEAGFNTVNETLNRISEREAQPTNWIGLGSLIAVLAVGFVTFVSLQTDPVRNRSIENSIAIEQLQLHRQRISSAEARIDSLMIHQQRVKDFMLDSRYTDGYTDGRIEEIHDRVLE